jgi:hypothetical protein
MNNMGDFLSSNFERAKNSTTNIVGLGLVGSAASSDAQYVHKSEVDRAKQHEIRRDSCRKEVKELKSQKMSKIERQLERDDIATNYTLSSLDDNQDRETIFQGLSLTGTGARGEEVLLVVGPNRNVWNNIPFFPSNRNGFLLATQNQSGRVRIISNPLSLAIPTENLPFPTTSTTPPSSGFSSSGPSPFGSINLSLPTKSEEYMVTTYNPLSKKATTQVVKANDLFKGKRVIFRGEEVQHMDQSTTERLQNVEEGVQDCVQGVNPNLITAFTRFEERGSNSSTLALIFLQFFLLFALSVPFFLSLFKKIFVNFSLKIKKLQKLMKKIRSTKTVMKLRWVKMVKKTQTFYEKNNNNYLS